MGARATAALLATVGVCAVALGQAPAGDAVRPRAAAEGAKASPQQARRAQVVASFADWRLTVGELEEVIAQKPAFSRKAFTDVEPRRELMRQAIDYELLVREAERRGYADHLAVHDAVEQRTVELLREQLAADADPSKLPAASVEVHYNENRELFALPALRRAAYLVFDTKQEAEQMRGRAQTMPLDELRRLAASRARTGDGGETGYVDAQGRRDGEAEDAPPDRAAIARLAFDLAHVGDVVAEPVQRGDRWLVVRLTGAKPATGQTLAEVEGAVREHLAKTRYEQSVDALVERLRGEYPPTVQPELSDAIHLEPGEPLDIPAGASAAPPDPMAPPQIAEPDGA